MNERFGLFLFLLALVLRLTVLGLTYHGDDSVAYYDDARIALNLVSGLGYSIEFRYRNELFYGVFLKDKTLLTPVVEGVKPTASKQPAYPILLSLFFLLFGAKHFFAVFLFHALLSSLTPTILFLALRQISRVVGMIAGLGTAVYPPFVFHSVTTPESTTLLLFLIAGFFLCLAQLKRSGSMRLWVATGFVGGLIILTEPVMIPFAGLCLSYATYFRGDGIRRNLRRVSAAFAAIALVVAPWLVRNYLVFGGFPIMKSPVGVIFNWGLEHSGRGTWIPEDRIIALEFEGRSKLETEEDAEVRRELIRLFPSHWREYVRFNVPSNFLHFWWEVKRYAEDNSMRYLLGRKAPYILLLVLALASLLRHLWRVVRHPRETLQTTVLETSALILIITCTLVYSIFGAYMSRYRFPVELVLFVFFAESVSALLGRRIQHGTPALAPEPGVNR